MSYLSHYAVFLIPLVAWFITQSIKIAVFTCKHGWNLSLAYKQLGHGHMPSAHTAFVTSLVTSVGYYSGIDSGAFAVATVLAIIIIDDSVRLRVYMGDQGRYLNMLVHELPVDKNKFPRLKERVGHKVSEVIVGAILGVGCTFLFIWLLKTFLII